MVSRTTIWRRRLTALALLAVIIGGCVVLLSSAGSGTLMREITGTGVKTEVLTIHSKALHRPIHVRVLLPPGKTAGRPLVVDLHGKGKAAPSGIAGGTGILDDLGSRAPVIVLAADDGDSYWHDRASGQWGSYIRNDLILQVETHYDLSPKTALSGLSMGGSGVLGTALVSDGRFCAVVASSPALFTSGAVSAAGAYDSAEDYAANNPFALLAAHPKALAGTPTWIDIGDRDPFLAATRTLVARAKPTTPRLRFTTEPGGHDGTFWRARYPRYLRWLAKQFASCTYGDSVKHES